ncbi:MAG TPA: A/G-specific adenine glycosylase [Methanospirillum sp.]|nr:A/G-specific adenine glycosylase [Methanospirillum sp.]
MPPVQVRSPDVQQILDTGFQIFFRAEAPNDRTDFIRMIHDFSTAARRPMPWREEITPYRVVVSEVMLQQTQVPRVLEKFPAFIARFPSFESLAEAELVDVLAAWQGLGYNRRARYLHQIAMIVTTSCEGQLPKDPVDLERLPGIGKATAGSIAAFAYNLPVVFIETNIRRVFIHHFFAVGKPVSDGEILPLVEITLDRENPREWYYALMDYGTWLAARVENPNRRSSHYSRQSRFEGSDRQIRGRILKVLIRDGAATVEKIMDDSARDEPGRVRRILYDLINEGFITETEGTVMIKARCE